MGTRGCYGFRLRGKDYLTYSHFDSHPLGLGADLVSELAAFLLAGEGLGFSVGGMLNTLRKTVEKIELIPESQEVYDTLRHQQGHLGHWLREEDRRMMDYGGFMLEGLHCEWGYVVNLDSERFEVYEGLNKDPEALGPYAAATKPDSHGYVGAERVLSIPISEMVDDYGQAVDRVKALYP